MLLVTVGVAAVVVLEPAYNGVSALCDADVMAGQLFVARACVVETFAHLHSVCVLL